MRRGLLYFFLFLSLTAMAENNAIKRFLSDLKEVGGRVNVVEEYNNQYVRIQLNDSATIELFYNETLTLNNMFVLMTVCAPQCSTSARVYSNIGEYLFPLEPTVQSIFPLATIDKETGKITWTDNDTWEY